MRSRLRRCRGCRGPCWGSLRGRHVLVQAVHVRQHLRWCSRRGRGKGQRVVLSQRVDVPFQGKGAVLAQQEGEKPFLDCGGEVVAFPRHGDSAQHDAQGFGPGGTRRRPCDKSLKRGRSAEVVPSRLCDERDAGERVADREKRAGRHCVDTASPPISYRSVGGPQGARLGRCHASCVEQQRYVEARVCVRSERQRWRGHVGVVVDGKLRRRALDTRLRN